MKLTVSITLLITNIIICSAQQPDSLNNMYSNSADVLLQNNGKILLGGYGEVHYNQPFSGELSNNGELDVHRIVMLLGYNFNSRTQFITELEFEHVKEVYVEQAFLQYKLNRTINIRGGLLLVPMGIINEYHEPTTFNGVERPIIDQIIVPTTWREIGFGVTGNYLPASLKYQLYILNGFNGYDGAAHLSGSSGLRKGRQKGAESFISSPNVSGKLEYFGLRGLNVGLSVYYGKTQSTLYDGIDKIDEIARSIADSSVVGISMVGIDARYSTAGWMLRGQLYYSGLSNTDQYNVFTAINDTTYNDVGNSMIGYYAELAYNVLHKSNTSKQLIPFFRYEYLDTHQTVENIFENNQAYKKTVLTTGLTLQIAKGAVVKTDIQFIKSANDDKFSKVFNAGFGVMF